MSADDRLQELFRRWQEAHELGQPVSIEELCRDCPELTGRLRRLVLAEHPTGMAPRTIVERSTPLLSAVRGSATSILDLAPGVEPVPGYTLVAMLGRGSFGQVWKATGPGGFPVAMKFVALEGEADSAEVRSLEVMKEIRHANLLALFGAWQQSDLLIVAMELADDTLLDRCNECRREGVAGIPGDELLEYMSDAAKGIDFLNESRHVLQGKEPVGIQHRDIKPQNLLRVGSSVKVADFGLAKILEHTAGSNSGSMTAAYAAPECFKGRTSHRSDQYSLAVTYCQLRGGRLPFSGSNIGEIMMGHVGQEPDLSMLPADEQAVVHRALAKNPEERWPSCRDFVASLQGATAPQEEFELVETPPPTPRDWSSARPATVAESMPTLLPALTPAPEPGEPWQSQPRRPIWPWVVGLAGLVALAGGITVGVLRTLSPPPEDSVAALPERPDAPRKKSESPELPTKAEPTRPAPPTEPKPPPPEDPEKKRKREAAEFAKKAAVARERKDWTEAIRLLDMAIQRDPENARYYFDRGKAQFESKEFGQAINDMTEAVKRDGSHAAAFVMRGRAHAELKEHNAAVKDFDTALILNPDDAATYTSRGTAHANLKHYDKALDDFEKALKRNPRSALALRNRGVVYAWKGDPDNAFLDFTAAIEADPNYAPAYGSRGRVYDQRKEYDKALADYNDALRLNPDYVWCWNARGVIHAHNRDYEKAVEDYSRAIKLDGNYVAAYANRALAYEHLNDMTKAKADWKKVKELNDARKASDPMP